MNKADLMDTLQVNRQKHRAVFEAAMEGYARQAREILEEQLAIVQRGGRPRQIRISLFRPEDHTADYDRAIRMIELHVPDTIELSEADAAHFLMDDWDWTRAWRKMSSGYAAGATEQAYGEIDDE